MKTILMTKFSTTLRLLSLSILFGGSLATLIAALTLIKTGLAHGLPLAQAAAINAPLFVTFSKLALGAGIALVLGESLNYAATGKAGKLKLTRYVVSLSCAALTMVFAFVIVPPMHQLQKSISYSVTSQEQFRKMHKASRCVYSLIMFLALASLMIPVFETSSPKDPA